VDAAARPSGPSRAPRLAGALVTAALAALPACERRAAVDPREGLRDTAARRGIAWLLAERNAMEPRWAFALFSYLAPIAPDAAIAGACRRILDEVSGAPFAELPPALDDPALLETARLQPIVAELLRRRWRNEPSQDAAAELATLLHRNAELLAGRTPLTQRAILLHDLEALGIEPPWVLDDVVRAVRGRWGAEEPEALYEDAGFMFALTHVFFAASGYFTRYPDPAIFGPEIAVLRGALRRYLAAPPPPSRFFLDVQAEVLVSLRLLRVPEDDDMRAMADRLLELQNPDGSWGEARANHRYHATIVAVQALLDWPDEFRYPQAPRRLAPK
jgi:hypothetical protein